MDKESDISLSYYIINSLKFNIMPNWCYTNIVLNGAKENIDLFENKLKELESSEKPAIPNGFGNMWLGLIVDMLGEDWHNVRCRGYICDFMRLDDKSIQVNIEHAWTYPDELMKLFMERFPDIELYYYAEEPGMEIYVSNDMDNLYFLNYVLDSQKDGIEYFENLSDVANAIGEIIGVTPEPDIDSINEAIKKYQENHDDFILFHEIEYEAL